jgi:hypothetical protein
MKDGKKLLAELGELAPRRVYFRAHNLLTSGDGTPALKWGSTGAYKEDPAGNPVYDWAILDRIFDAYVERGVKPYAQIGFMPKDLSIKPEPYQHKWTPKAKYDEIYTGWAYPPKDYKKWAGLVFEWVKHCVGRYGRQEVESWYWEVWNEPNIGYWRGNPADFRKLHDYAIEPSAGRYRPPGSAARTRPAAGDSSASSWTTACGGRTTRPAGRAPRSTSSRSTRKGRPRSSAGTSGWGSPGNSRRSTRTSASSRLSRN